jgi:AraC-like DNA-binding protein
MESIVNKLIEYSNLTIVDFDVTSRNELEVHNRKTSYNIMTYLQKGSADIIIGDKTYHAGPGTAVIIPSNTKHDHIQTTSETSIFFWWHFYFTIADTFNMMKVFDFPIMFEIYDRAKFESVFKRYSELAKKNSSLEHVILKKALSFEVMAMVFGSAMEKKNYDNDGAIPHNFIEILSYIVENSSNMSGLKELSHKFNMHPTYISNQFKRYFGTSPIQLQQNIQLANAKSLLRTRELRINEIADMLGYDSIYAFSRFFSAKAGMSPTAFRKNNL